ncbi:MAG: cytochrome P450 [Acidimicrobiia bacterium]
MASTDASGPISIEEMELPRLDVLSEEYAADPIGMLRDARIAGNGMAKSHRGVEFLSYDWVGKLLVDDRFHTVDAKHFEQKGAPEIMQRWARDGLLLSMEKARHDKVRLVFARAFTLRRVDQHRALMAEVAAKWAEIFGSSRDHDLIDDFTLHYPMELLCRAVGVPVEEIPRFISAALDLHLLAAVPMAPGFERIGAALQTMEDYVVDILDRRRREPTDDFLSGLIEAQAIEGELSQSELTGNVINLLFAGAGTTKFQLASAIKLFIELGMWDQLAADHSLIPAAIEEAMRIAPVTQFVVRIPHDDVVIDNMLFPAKRRIILNLQAASRDPAMFPDPDTFDMSRDNLGKSRLPFGWGSHYCLGHAFARSSMREGTIALTDRFTNMSIRQPVEVAPAAAMMRGPEHLHLAFDRR